MPVVDQLSCSEIKSLAVENQTFHLDQHVEVRSTSVVDDLRWGDIQSIVFEASTFDSTQCVVMPECSERSSYNR